MARRVLTRCGPAFLAIAALFQPNASAQVTEYFGEWDGAATLELYVAFPPLGAIGNPGTRALPLPTITSALAAAAGLIGTVPVTINVIDPGPASQYNFAAGESFPIVIPAHGVTIEAYFAVGPNGPIVAALPGGASETFLINSVGNVALPHSTIRGLEIRNSFVANAADIRIAVPANGTANEVRVAPEIRDCVITGAPVFGVQMLSSNGITLEPVLERNVITSIDPFLGTAGVDVVGVTGINSPLIRSNRIQLYQTNLRVNGGGLSTQPRVESNFIQIGNVNVDLTSCAPFLLNNTIAFAGTQTASQPVFGLRWLNLPAFTLSNNIIWNPLWSGASATDVAGNLAVFNNPPRFAWFNMDEDNTLFTASMASVPGVVTIYNTPVLGPPVFVGANPPTFPAPVDLHLQPTSPCIGAGFDVEVANAVTTILSATVPGFPVASLVRRDVAYDIDFEGRLEGIPVMLQSVDLGADEFTGVDAFVVPSPTRAAVLRRTSGSTIGTDMDIFGNLQPDATGLWNTQIEVVGNPGDLAIVMAGFAFVDRVIDPSTSLLIENRSVNQDFVLNNLFVPGMLTSASLGVEIGAHSLNLAIAAIPPSGVLTVNVTLGLASSALAESEMQFQALVADPTLTMIQTTARLTLEVNE
jgi:hypothetical protein